MEHFDQKQCRRCRITQQANNIQVNIYESPIPSKQESALAVMFQLRMPIEIRYYRDIIWKFNNRSQLQSSTPMYQWLTTIPHSTKLEPLFTGPTHCKVKLVSSKNSITQSQRSIPSIASASIEQFLYENSLDVQNIP